MKNLFYLLVLLYSTLSFAQINTENPDYFVQYNGDQLTKKVSVAEVVNHSLLKEYNKKIQEFTVQELDAVFRLDQKITIHGNFTDSISYNQVTIPLKNSLLLKDILLHKKVANDSLETGKNFEIQDFGSWSMVLSDTHTKKPTMAWNQDYLVFFELTSIYRYDDYTVADVEEEIVAVSDENAPELPPAPNYEENDIIIDDLSESPVAVEEVSQEIIVDDDATGENNYYLERKTVFNRLQTQDQEELVKTMFQNGFAPPHSDKVDPIADISSWINYRYFFENANKVYSILGGMSGRNGYLPNQNIFGDFIKGINFNAYFDNDKARIEEVIEYSEEMAQITEKITDRKINKRVYSYFPVQKPLGYLSYHFDSGELLKNIPSFTNQFFGGQSPFKEDFTLITDLITILVDEKATATLLDGDFSFFVHDIISKEVKTKTYSYDENYESIEKEEITTKSIPLFTMVFTSTHPSFGDKLIQLGVRKGLLKQEGNLYTFKESAKYGKIFVLKDKDVVVIGNVFDAFNKDFNATFVKDIKKNLKKNALVAEVDLEKVAKSYQTQSKEKSANDDKFIKLSRHFNSLQMQSPKKLKDNKFSIEMILNSTQNGKNIILQFLDAVQEMK